MLKLAWLCAAIMHVALQTQAKEIDSEGVTKLLGMIQHKMPVLPEEILVEEHFDLEEMMENEEEEEDEDEEEEVYEEQDEGEHYLSPKAVRKRASRKVPIKLSELSNGLRYLNVPCADDPIAIIVEAGETVIFTSPNFPKKYPKNQYCGWHLYGDAVTRFNITCQKFNVEKRKKGKSCPDHLFLEEEQFCGKKKADRPTEWVSYDWWDNVIFSFVSNKKKQYKGFTCTATAYIRESLIYATTGYPATDYSTTK